MSMRAGRADFSQQLLHSDAWHGPCVSDRHDVFTSGILGFTSWRRLWPFGSVRERPSMMSVLVGSFHPVCVFFNGWKWRFCRFTPSYQMCFTISLVYWLEHIQYRSVRSIYRTYRTDIVELSLSFCRNYQLQQVNVYSRFRLLNLMQRSLVVALW